MNGWPFTTQRPYPFVTVLVVVLLLALNPWFSGHALAQTVIATIPVGAGPIGVAVNPTTTRIYTANIFDGVTVIDGSTNTVVTTLSGFSGPILMAADATTNRIYVTNSGNDTLGVLDGGSNTLVTSIPVGSSPRGVAVNPTTDRIYVSNFAGNTVSVIDRTTNTVLTTVSGFSNPNFVAVSLTTNRIYVTNAGSDTLAVLDGSTNTLVTSIPVGSNPHGVAVNDATNRIYVANPGSSTVSVIDQTTNTVVTTVSGFSGPVGIDVNIITNRIFVANNGNSLLSVLDGGTNTIMATVPIGNSANGVAVNDATNHIYVANFADNTVSVIEDGPSVTPRDFYLHGTGPNNNPPTLFLDNTPPVATTAKFRDSAAVSFSGGNPWKDIGTWSATPALSAGTLTTLSDLHVWLGLKNSDDQGTRFDLRAEVYKNGSLVASGETACITGVTRNPDLAKEVSVAFGAFTPLAFNGSTDVLSLKVLTRIGTNGAGGLCGGHSNAVGLRLYFDATNRPAKFDATL